MKDDDSNRKTWAWKVREAKDMIKMKIKEEKKVGKMWEEKKKWWEYENERLKKRGERNQKEKRRKKKWWENNKRRKKEKEKEKRDEIKVKRRFWGMMWHVVPMVLSWCVWTKLNEKRCDWFCSDVFKPNLMWPVMPCFYPDVFGPNLMWYVVLGSIMMCLDQTWYDLLCWCDLIVVKNLKDSKFKRKIQKFKWEIGT